MPVMETDLNAGAAALRYTVSVYLLGMSLRCLPVGVLSDEHGRKPLLLSCIGLLFVTSLGYALVDNIVVLLGLRFVQGAVSSAFIILAVAGAADCFQGARLTSVNGMLGAAWAACSATGLRHGRRDHDGHRRTTGSDPRTHRLALRIVWRHRFGRSRGREAEASAWLSAPAATALSDGIHAELTRSRTASIRALS